MARCARCSAKWTMKHGRRCTVSSRTLPPLAEGTTRTEVVDEGEELVRAYAKSVREVDSHARKCHRCNARRPRRPGQSLTSYEPYKLCRVAVRLDEAAVEARKKIGVVQ